MYDWSIILHSFEMSPFVTSLPSLLCVTQVGDRIMLAKALEANLVAEEMVKTGVVEMIGDLMNHSDSGK